MQVLSKRTGVLDRAFHHVLRGSLKTGAFFTKMVNALLRQDNAISTEGAGHFLFLTKSSSNGYDRCLGGKNNLSGFYKGRLRTASALERS